MKILCLTISKGETFNHLLFKLVNLLIIYAQGYTILRRAFDQDIDRSKVLLKSDCVPIAMINN